MEKTLIELFNQINKLIILLSFKNYFKMEITEKAPFFTKVFRGSDCYPCFTSSYATGEMVWTGCNKYCGNSVTDGVLESSLSVTIDHNLLCIRLCAFYKSSLDIVGKQREDTLVVRVEGSLNLLLR